MKYNYEIKIFNNCFEVAESRNQFGGLRRTKKHTKSNKNTRKRREH